MEIENFDSSSLIETLKSCFSASEIEDLARSSKFIRRSSSRLSGLSFLQMNVFDSSDGKERSLNDCCDWLSDEFDISMTKQSLDERYNTDAVSFMRSCFKRTLEILNKDVVKSISGLPFSRIQLTDATSFKIPSNLSPFYVGHDDGGATIKMHFNYNLLNGEVADLLLTDGVSNDSSYKFGKDEQIEANGLYIRDLGYLNSTYLNALEQGGAYFLSRSKSNSVYSRLNEKGEYMRLNLYDYLPEEGEVKELSDIYLGGKKVKTKVRLIMQRVPEEVGQERLKKLEAKKAKHKNWVLSQQAKDMCWFNVYITNAPEEKLPACMVRLVYSLRWQIELIFKIWKSIFDIDKVKKMSIFRFECYIYAKLITILLTLHIQNTLGEFLWEEEEFEISPMKAAKLIKKNLRA